MKKIKPHNTCTGVTHIFWELGDENWILSDYFA